MNQQITVKLKLKSSIKNDIENFQRKFNNIIRVAFNRFIDGHKKNDIRKSVQTLNNVNELDVTWKREAVTVAEAIYSKNESPDNKVIFGGKKLFYERLTGKLSKDEYKIKRKLIPISCEGSKCDPGGNRKFKFNTSTMSGSVKLNNKTVYFDTYSVSKKQMSLLSRALELGKNHEIPVTYKLDSDHVYISFELKLLKELEYEHIKDRTLAIDSNPNYIGLSIVENDMVIYKEYISLKDIVDNKNKKKYEVCEITKHISTLCRHWHVNLVGFEKLKIKSEDKKKGKRFNRDVNNEWFRGLFFNSLKKRLELIGCNYREIAAQYSSFIGCINYPGETDSIAASIEINRRLRKFTAVYIDKTHEKSGIIYPTFSIDRLNHWKEEACQSGIKDWYSFYVWMKKTRHSYRFLHNDWLKANGLSVFRLRCGKSLIGINSIKWNRLPIIN